jgi:hypothetical protein
MTRIQRIWFIQNQQKKRRGVLENPPTLLTPILWNDRNMWNDAEIWSDWEVI